jgi:acyl-CoA synthetase (NDP forming)
LTTALESPVARLLAEARSEGRDVLLEPEGLDLLRSLDIAVPIHRFVRGAREAASVDLSIFPGDRLVLKAVSPRILHKTEVGGVQIVPRSAVALAGAAADMERRFAGDDLRGLLLCEYVPHDRSLGRELILGARWTGDFGPVVTLGAGGIHAEFLASRLRPGQEVAILSPALMGGHDPAALLAAGAIPALITGRQRGQPPLIDMPSLLRLLRPMLEFAAGAMPHDAVEFEINPLALTDRGPVALDVLCRLGDGATPATTPARPTGKIAALLRPRSIALIGASSRMNLGRIILRNILRAGYPSERVVVVKPDCDLIDGCRCVPDVGALRERVDLLVVAVAAPQVPDLLRRVIEGRKAESLILVPSGVGERQGTEGIERELRALLSASRGGDWGGPLLNGGNCLGIRSRPGRYDTMFIPEHKLPPPRGPESPLAVISQSGAFAVARASRLQALNPRYIVTIGNQTDLTAGDYLEEMKNETSLKVYACYVEGFRPLDGLKWLRAAADIAAGGRTVILYRAGRTEAGGRAAASHTASIAGDYAVTRELARGAGAVVADSVDDFDDLVSLFTLLHDREARGFNLGALSNSGFECVALGDNLARLRLTPFSPRTRDRLGALFTRAGIDKVMDIHNPLDLTPMMDDPAFAGAAEAVLCDEAVDVGIIGCVPLSGALNTLAAGPGHGENVAAEDSLASRLIRLRASVRKPWVAVVDGGPLYDGMAGLLQRGGVPVFRTADRALRLLEIFCRRRLPG